MNCRLLNLLTVVSLLLCITAGVVWWSYGGSTKWWVYGKDPSYAVVVPFVDGQLSLTVFRPYSATAIKEVEFSRLRLPGFWYRHAGGGDWKGEQYWAAGMSYWLFVVLTSILPAAWVARRMLRRPRAGSCSRCGYDLRASPDRCPECGLAASPA